MSSVQEINEAVAKQMPLILQVVEEMGKVMVGQKDLIQKLFIGLLADGHILVEGVPGLAKTTAIKTLSDTIHAQFRRIQFTPDLLPADLVGTANYFPKDGSFRSSRGQSSRTSCLPTRSIALRRKCKVLFWRRCRSGR